MNEDQKKIYDAFIKAMETNAASTQFVCDACRYANYFADEYPCRDCVFITVNHFEERES